MGGPSTVCNAKYSQGFYISRLTLTRSLYRTGTARPSVVLTYGSPFNVPTLFWQTRSSWPRMVDSATQTTLPDIATGDLQADGQKTRLYTGFISFPMMMHFLAVLVQHGADSMRYWAGAKCSLTGSSDRQYHKQGVSKPGPKRTLSLRSEFLMVMTRLRLGLAEQHLADTFKVSSSTVS